MARAPNVIDRFCGFGRVLCTTRFIRTIFTFRAPPPSSQKCEVRSTHYCATDQFSTMGCSCLCFWSFSLYQPSREYDWLPHRLYILHDGDILAVIFDTTKITNGGVFADTQLPPFSESSASWNVFPGRFFGWSLMFAASDSLSSSSFEGIGFLVV